MEIQYSILIYQRAGRPVDWYSEGFYGPFESKEEREKWLNEPENALTGNDRYIVKYLSK